MKAAIVGLGNTICGNDAVGIIIANKLKSQLQGKSINGINIDVYSIEGSLVNVIDFFADYNLLLLIDAIPLGGKVGDIYWLDKELIMHNYQNYSSHQLTIAQLLDFAQKTAVAIPEYFYICAIEIGKINYEYSQNISLQLEEKLSQITQQIKEFFITNLKKIKKRRSVYGYSST